MPTQHTHLGLVFLQRLQLTPAFQENQQQFELYWNSCTLSHEGKRLPLCNVLVERPLVVQVKNIQKHEQALLRFWHVQGTAIGTTDSSGVLPGAKLLICSQMLISVEMSF